MPRFDPPQFSPEDASRRAASMLKSVREEIRASQRQLADSAGVDSSVVSKLESGRQDARLSTWFKLFLALGCRVELVVTVQCEEAEDYLRREGESRRDRRRDGLDRRW